MTHTTVRAATAALYLATLHLLTRHLDKPYCRLYLAQQNLENVLNVRQATKSVL